MLERERETMLECVLERERETMLECVRRASEL